MLCETLHGLRSQRLVLHDEGFTSPDFVVNGKDVHDKIRLALRHVTSSKLQPNNRNYKNLQGCREKRVLQASNSLHAACCVYSRYKRRAVD